MNFLSIFRSLLWLLPCLVTCASHAMFFSSIKRYSLEDGLPTTTIYTLLQDETGYFWLGTPKGLVRYDGYDFEVYSSDVKHNIQLVLPDAGNIFIDSKQRLWIGSWGKGVALYDRDLTLMQHFAHASDNPNSIGSNMVQSFLEDAQGNIWLGTNGGGLALYREETGDFRNFANQPGDDTSISHNRVWSIAQAQDGSLWIATNDGLNQLVDSQRGIFKKFKHTPDAPGGLNHPLVRALLIDRHDRLWIGTGNGFGVFDKDTGAFERFDIQQQQFDVPVTRLRETGDGGIWVGTQKGLYRFDTGAEHFTPLVSDSNYALLPHDDVRDIFVASAERIWVATRYSGLTRIDLTPSNFEGYHRYQTVNGDNGFLQKVYDFYQQQDQTLWIGSDAGLLRFTPNGPVQHDLAGFDSSSDVYTLAQDSAGQIWLGSEEGLGKLSPDQRRYIDRNDILGETQRLAVTELLIDSENLMWIATDHGGLLQFDGTNTRVVAADPSDSSSLASDYVTALLQDSIGRTWVGTGGHGLHRLDPGSRRFFRYEYLLGSRSFGNINSLFQSSDGTMWVGTPSSLDKLIDITDTFESLSTDDGLANSNIKSIVEDDYGNIWLSTELGISQYKRGQNYFVNYTVRDGLHGHQFLHRSVVKSPTHGILFGGENGLTRIHPTSNTTATAAFEAQITGVWIDGKKIKKHNVSGDLPIQLHHTVKNIRIAFSALDFANSDKQQYMYRTLGFDENWSTPSGDNQINYRGLTSGEYEFQVMAGNSSNNWSKSPTSLKLIILTPWWQQPWLYVAIFSIVAFSAWFYYNHRTQTLALQKEQLEQAISSRTKELFEAQKQLIEAEKNASLSGLVAGVAHEINTPVGISVTAASNLIERSQTLLDALRQNTLRKSEFVQQINNMQTSAEMVLSNLMRASDLIGSFKEVSVDQISQQRRVFAVKDYLQEIVMSLTPQLNSRNINTEILCPDDLVVESYPGALAQLITNLTMNAIMHAFDEHGSGEICIYVAKMTGQPEKLYLRFSDNGKGISKDNLTKIFEPFYTTKRGRGGSGLGLQIVSNITNIRFGGTIRCESTLGEGASFHMEILATPP